MRTGGAISYFANGPLKANIYKSEKAIAMEIGDTPDDGIPDKVGIFVDPKYAKHLSVAVIAFNEAWKMVEAEATRGMEHE